MAGRSIVVLVAYSVTLHGLLFDSRLVLAATIEYSYIDSAGTVQPTAAEITWPQTKPKGVILLWHGTLLGGMPDFGGTPAQEFQSLTGDKFLRAFKSDHIVVMPQQLGLGVSKLTRNQLWQQLTPVQKDGDAVLTAVYAKAKTDYQLADNERLNLYITGFSQGGTSAVVYHLHYQSVDSTMPTMYELKLSTASAGHYSAAVWEHSCMSDYNDFEQNQDTQASFTRPQYFQKARRMQNVLLTHLLHTYNMTIGSASITYEAAPDVSNPAYKDDWSQMHRMIGISMREEGSPTDKPAFLTDDTWAAILDKTSALRVALRQYLQAQYDPIAAALPSNAVPLEVIYACDDFNVPCAHSKALPQSAPGVTFTDASAAVPYPLPNLFAGHQTSHQKCEEITRTRITALKDTAATPNVPLTQDTDSTADDGNDDDGNVTETASGTIQLLASEVLLATASMVAACVFLEL